MSTHLSTDQIYQDGRHYDRLFPHADEPPQFWLDQAEFFGGPILELACGTGRIAIPLAQQGHHVSGIDLSLSMLAEARHKAALADVELDLHHGDMSDFTLNRRFSLILLANNALCHLLDLAAFERCMVCVRQHLQKNCYFIVEVFVPNLHFLTIDPTERMPFSEYDDPDGKGRIVITSTAHYDAATQIRYNHTFYKYPEREEEVAGELPMRMYFPQELDALFKYNGFTIEQKWGSSKFEPFGPTSNMQIFLLRPTD